MTSTPSSSVERKPGSRRSNCIFQADGIPPLNRREAQARFELSNSTVFH
jgi:hypothetical protein